jgi:hypothetical protein
MGDTINIGGPSSRATWASLRAPIWKGSGYRGEVLPKNKNWTKVVTGSNINSRIFNYGYTEAVSPLLRAFPFSWAADPGVGLSWSTCLGLYNLQIQNPDPEADPPVPAILEFWLCLGQAQGRSPRFYPDYAIDDVYPGYGGLGKLAGKGTGYDINTTRDTMRGAVVNVTFQPGPFLPFETSDVVITDELFPDNPDWRDAPFSLRPLPGRAIYIGTYTWPVGGSSFDWPQPYWTINSVTMPS